MCILQGPVAVKGSIIKDEPIKDLLGNINSSLIKRLLERKYHGDASSIPGIDYLAAKPAPVAKDIAGVKRTEQQGEIIYQFGSSLPETSAWLEILGGSELNWLRALVTSNIIVQGTSYIDNPIRRLLAPRVEQKVIVKHSGAVVSSVSVYGAARSYGSHISDFKSVEIVFHPSSQLIDITIFEERLNVSVPLVLHFQYRPTQGFAPIHEIADDRNTRIKQFYWKLWYGDDAVLPEIDIRETFVGPEVTIEAEAVEKFCAVVGNQGESFKTVRNDAVQAPMDFAIVTGWKVHDFFPILIIDLIHYRPS